MANFGGVKVGLTKAEEARFDATGLLLAKMIDMTTEKRPNGSKVSAMMGDLLSDPERLGAVCLIYMGMIRQLADARPGGFYVLCQHLTDALPERA